MGESQRLILPKGSEGAKGALKGLEGYQGNRVLDLVGGCRVEAVVVRPSCAFLLFSNEESGLML